MIVRIEKNDVHWFLTADERKTPVTILENIISAGNIQPSTEQYLTCLSQVKDILEGMTIAEEVDRFRRVRGGCQIRDNYGPVYEYQLTSRGLETKPIKIYGVEDRKL